MKEVEITYPDRIYSNKQFNEGEYFIVDRTKESGRGMNELEYSMRVRKGDTVYTDAEFRSIALAVQVAHLLNEK